LAHRSGIRLNPEGLADPASFANDLDGFSDAEIRLVMRGNARRLVLAPA
jgi:hypothetical protein